MEPMSNPYDFPPGVMGYSQRPRPPRSNGLGTVILLVLMAGVSVFLISRWVWTGTVAKTLRPTVARGELGSDEKSTIDIFTQTNPSVVFITTLGERYDLYTGDAREVP